MGGMVYLAVPRFAIIFHSNAFGKRLYRSLFGQSSSHGGGVNLKETVFAGAVSQIIVTPGTIE